MKRMTLFVMALAMVLGLAQCKKDQPTPETQGVTITLNLEDNNSGAKVNVDPYANEQVTFEDGDQILVASGGHYIGTLTRENGVFAGNVIDPVEGERLYFYFLGNKQGTLETGATACSVNISDQGGTITAIGGPNAAGIGSGGWSDGTCASISITGGTVYATGGNSGAGIGQGYYGVSCGVITIGNGITRIEATRVSDYTECIGRSQYYDGDITVNIATGLYDSGDL